MLHTIRPPTRIGVSVGVFVSSHAMALVHFVSTRVAGAIRVLHYTGAVLRVIYPVSAVVLAGSSSSTGGGVS